MAVQGIPNSVWVYKNKPDPLTGAINKGGKYVVNLLTGDRLNAGEVYKARHGGLSHAQYVEATGKAVRRYHRTTSPGHKTAVPVIRGARQFVARVRGKGGKKPVAGETLEHFNKRAPGSLVEVEIADQCAWMLKAHLTQLDEFLLPFSGDTDVGRLQHVSPWLPDPGHGRRDAVSEAHRRRRRDDTPGAASPWPGNGNWEEYAE